MINLTTSRTFRGNRIGWLLVAFMLAVGALPSAHAQFKDFIVFGDSLSDTGNIAERSSDDLGISYPGSEFNYDKGRFTNGKDTDPAARTRTRVWHEQLAMLFLGVPRAKPSLNGGSNYAFGGAKTIDSDTNRAVVEDPFFGNEIKLTIDNMGKQVSDYLRSHNPAADSLFIVWGGSNDLLDKPDSTTVAETASNVSGIITRLAKAGARNFLVPNVPPLHLTPNYAKDAKAGDLARVSAEYRDALSVALDNVQTTLAAGSPSITVNIYRLDVYSFFLRIYGNPNPYGITNVTDPAQGEDKANPDRYLSWDGLHPTTIGHYLLAAEAYTVLTGLPVVAINSITSEVPEQGGLGVYYLTRTGEDLSASLSIPYTVSGDATTGVDFKTFKGLKEMKPEKRSVQVKLKTLDDATEEKDEAVTLTIGTGSGYTVGLPKAATIAINDDED
jgi:phospholipase/lecithinase/hemolysin